MFPDESSFTLDVYDRRQRVCRRPNKRYSNVNVRPLDRFGGGSIMVLGGITLTVRNQLHIVHNIGAPMIVFFARHCCVPG